MLGAFVFDMTTMDKGFFERNAALFSYKTGEYITPKWLYDQLNEEFHFYTDPCTTEDNPLHAPWFYTKADDGLESVWYGNVYVNPPYGKDIGLWIKKACFHALHRGEGTVVMLLPARTDTKWFHDYIWNKPSVEIRFLRGRLKFGGTDKPNTADFPSMIVIFRGSKT